jgi:hypothetical protein
MMLSKNSLKIKKRSYKKQKTGLSNFALDGSIYFLCFSQLIVSHLVTIFFVRNELGPL